MNIINVYNALAECGMKPDLSSDIHVATVQMGWLPVFQDFVVCRDKTIQGFQVGIALNISTRARELLLTPEHLKTFDMLIAEAQEKWVELHRTNKVSRILTDYLRAS